MYAYWVCAARETPIFSPEFSFRSISFSQITKIIRSGASPFYTFCGFCRSGDHHFQNFFNFNPFVADFAVPETIISKISLILTRSSPPTAGSARTQSVRQRRGLAAGNGAPARRVLAVPETSIFKLKTAQARSGAPHFHARPGARSGALAHFSLCRGTYLPTFGVIPPPPPPVNCIDYRYADVTVV